MKPAGKESKREYYEKEDAGKIFTTGFSDYYANGLW